MNHTNVSASYEELPYPPYSFPATHIARLGAIGRLFSLPTADPRQARVLELGCGSGFNLLAMAQLYPGAEFIGIDLSRRHIEQADGARSAAGLLNTRFIEADIARIGEDLGAFDYIIAHGVYSWVPAEVRESILRGCRNWLQPGGVAYISYNCLPGWRMRGTLRDMMQMHSANAEGTRAKVEQSKSLIRFLAESCTEDTPHGRLMRHELELLRGADDGYLAHDFLEETNDAFYFTDFLKAAAAHDLAYLSDADPGMMGAENLPSRVAEGLKSLTSDCLAAEQYLDFARSRMFRNTLLCHSRAVLSRPPRPATLRDLEVTALGPSPKPAPTSGPAGLGTLRPMDGRASDPGSTDILSRLIRSARHSRPCDEVIDEAVDAQATSGDADRTAARDEIGQLLLQHYYRRTIDLSLGPWAAPADMATANPCALPLARWQAAQGLRVSSHRLDMHQPDPLLAKLIPLCDGTRDRTALVGAITEAIRDGELRIEEHGKPIQDPERLRSLIEKIHDGSMEKLRQIGILREL